MKSYKVTYADGSVQYVGFESEAEAKAWRDAESVKSVTAGEPKPLEPAGGEADEPASGRGGSGPMFRG